MTMLQVRSIRSSSRGRAAVLGENKSTPNVESTFDVRFEGIEAGALVGSIADDASEELEEILIAVGRRTLEIVPLGATGRGARRSFRFDLRSLPPALLLEARVSVGIRPKQQPTKLLATWEIETNQICPFTRLSVEKGRLEGYIDAKDSDLVRGWVWDPASRERRIKLHLFVEGRFCGLYEASSPRPDLEALGRGDGRYGFSIPSTAFFARAGSDRPRVDVVSIEPEFWRVPPAPHLEPGNKSRQRPRLSQIPTTTRELVALLAGNAPLPKKVFAIDRATVVPHPFSADYQLLGLEFLRVELIKSIEAAPSTLRERLLVRFRQRSIQDQISRLASLVEASVASQRAVGRALRPKTPTGIAER